MRRTTAIMNQWTAQKCTGKNLFDVNKFVELIMKYDNTATIETVDGRRCVRFLNQKIYSKDFTAVFNVSNAKGVTLTMHIKQESATTAGGLFIQLHSGTNEDRTTLTFAELRNMQEFTTVTLSTTASDTNVFLGLSYGTQAYWYIDIDSIQLEYGTVATEYEPYCGGRSDFLQVNNCKGGYVSTWGDGGRNMFDVNSRQTIINACTEEYSTITNTLKVAAANSSKWAANYYIIGKYELLKGKTLTLSHKYRTSPESTGRMRIGYLSEDSNKWVDCVTGKGLATSTEYQDALLSGVIPDNIDAVNIKDGYIAFTLYSNADGELSSPDNNWCEYTDIMLCIGSTALPYERYYTPDDTSEMSLTLKVKGKMRQENTPTPQYPSEIMHVPSGTKVTVYGEQELEGNSVTTVPCSLYEGDVWYPMSGKVVRNTGVCILTGTETIVDYRQEDNTDTYKGFWIQNVLSNSNNYTKTQYSNRFTPGRASSTGYYPNVFICHSNGHLYLRTEIEGVDSVEAFKNWLTELYNAGTPVTFVYQLTAPVTEYYAPQPMRMPSGVVNVMQQSDGLQADLEMTVLVRR